MKVSQEELDFIKLVIKTAEIAGIESVIIEPGKVRAMNEVSSVVLRQDKNVPKLSFGSIGLNRLSAITSRLNLIATQENNDTTVITNGDDPTIGYDVYDKNIHSKTPMWARSLIMQGGGMSVEYRCTNPQAIIAPKQQAGVLLGWITYPHELVSIIQKGQSAMKSDTLTIICNEKDSAVAELVDINGDKLKYRFSKIFDSYDEDESLDFVFSYDIKTVLPLFKSSTDYTIRFTTRGSLIFTINNIDIYVYAKG